MIRSRPLAYVGLAISTVTILAGAPAALAAARPLVTGQTISLPLNDEVDGPELKLTVKSAVIAGGGFVPREKSADRKARAGQLVLDSPDGKVLVKFIRFAAEDLTKRQAAQPTPRTATISAVVADKISIDMGKHMGDSLKAGFTFGLGASSTTPMNFTSHMEFAVDGKTFTCDATAPGRVPAYPRRNDPHAHDASDKMAEDARAACWGQVADQLSAALSAPTEPTAVSAPQVEATTTTGH